jgi:spore coat protein SA
MKVALVNADLLPVPPVLGGAIEHTLFETAMAIRRPQVTVISPWSRSLKKCEGLDRGTFRHVHISNQEKKARRLLGPKRIHNLMSPREARLFHYASGVADLLDELDPDIIQMHNRPEIVPFLIDQFPGKQVILYQHNDARHGSPQVRQAARLCHHAVFVSAFLARRFADRHPCISSKSTVMHNSVDTAAWHPELRESERAQEIHRQYRLHPGQTVLFVGRTVPQKGLHHLLDAMALVRRSLPDSKLLVVGSPLFGAVERSRYLKALKRQAARLGDGVVFAGFVRREDTPYYYAAADVAVVPSTWQEPFGKVVIEAMAAGLPVIGSRRGAIPEIIEDGVNGVLADPAADVCDLAARIVSLLTDDSCRSRLALAARRSAVRHFDTQVRLKRTRSFYRAISAGTELQNNLGTHE